jgi:hypothetical protein
LAATGLAGDASGEADSGTVVVAVDDHGVAMVRAGAWQQDRVVGARRRLSTATHTSPPRP